MNHRDAGCLTAALRLKRIFRPRDGSLGRDALKPDHLDLDARSFMDVRRACHDWLMQRDEHYRNDHLRRAAEREEQAAAQNIQDPEDAEAEAAAAEDAAREEAAAAKEDAIIFRASLAADAFTTFTASPEFPIPSL